MAQARAKKQPKASKKAATTTKKTAAARSAPAPRPAPAPTPATTSTASSELPRSRYVPAKDRTPKQQEEWLARLKRQRWGNPRPVARCLTYCRRRLAQPMWTRLGVDPTPLWDWFDKTTEFLQAAAEAQSKQPRWPKPRVGDMVAVRDKHLATYADGRAVTTKMLEAMKVDRLTAAKVWCVLESGNGAFQIPFPPRHLRPVYIIEGEEEMEEEDAPDSGDEDEEEEDEDEEDAEESVRGPGSGLDDDAGDPVGEDAEEDADDLVGDEEEEGED